MGGRGGTSGSTSTNASGNYRQYMDMDRRTFEKMSDSNLARASRIIENRVDTYSKKVDDIDEKMKTAKPFSHEYEVLLGVRERASNRYSDANMVLMDIRDAERKREGY